MWNIAQHLLTHCQSYVNPTGFTNTPLRLLVQRARRIAQQYKLVYKESIPVSQLVHKVATVMQEYTQSGWVDMATVTYLKAGFEYP